MRASVEGGSVIPNGITGASAPGSSPHPEEAPRWNAEAATILRSVCGLSDGKHRRAMHWWKRVRSKGERFGVRDADIAAAIRGLSRVMRIDPPWEPYRLFCRKNAALWQEAMSAGHKAAARGPRPLGRILEELRREAR